MSFETKLSFTTLLVFFGALLASAVQVERIYGVKIEDHEHHAAETDLPADDKEQIASKRNSKRGWIELPPLFPTTPSPAVTSPTTAATTLPPIIAPLTCPPLETTTVDCSCGSGFVAVTCNPGEYCKEYGVTSAQCTRPYACNSGVISELPCKCGISERICDSGSFCDANGMCVEILACRTDGPVPGPCTCGTLAQTCRTGEICTEATSTCSAVSGVCRPSYPQFRPPPGATPCLCHNSDTDSTTVCLVGQRCNDNSPQFHGCSPASCTVPVMPGDPDCLCGTELCVSGQTCTDFRCTPPRCAASLKPIGVSCLCGDDSIEKPARTCEPKQICVPDPLQCMP